MSQTAIYHTTVRWVMGHLGRIQMGNGPEMDFSAPPDAKGMPNLLTPEDAFVGAVNTCIMMMFIWACERFKVELQAYVCKAEGKKLIQLDRTEIFSEVRLFPVIKVKRGIESTDFIEKRIRQALISAEKYSLVANSIKSEVIIEPVIEID